MITIPHSPPSSRVSVSSINQRFSATSTVSDSLTYLSSLFSTRFSREVDGSLVSRPGYPSTTSSLEETSWAGTSFLLSPTPSPDSSIYHIQTESATESNSTIGSVVERCRLSCEILEEARGFCSGARHLQLDQFDGGVAQCISELRDATIEEYGCEVFDYVNGSKEPRHTVTPNLNEVDECEEDAPSVYDIAMKLRSQITADEEAEAARERRMAHRIFSLFISPPVTPRKSSRVTDIERSPGNSILASNSDFNSSRTSSVIHYDHRGFSMPRLSTELPIRWLELLGNFTPPPSEPPSEAGSPKPKSIGREKSTSVVPLPPLDKSSPKSPVRSWTFGGSDSPDANHRNPRSWSFNTGKFQDAEQENISPNANIILPACDKKSSVKSGFLEKAKAIRWNSTRGLKIRRNK